MKELHLKDILMRKPRYVPKDIAPRIPTLQLAFDDSLLIIELTSATAQPYALAYSKRSSYQHIRIVFEMAWRSAKKN